jgi:hypothetical protein
MDSPARILLQIYEEYANINLIFMYNNSNPLRMNCLSKFLPCFYRSGQRLANEILGSLLGTFISCSQELFWEV